MSRNLSKPKGTVEYYLWSDCTGVHVCMHVHPEVKLERGGKEKMKIEVE